eukprot:813648-Prorocentrum_lima.AAC.1
MYGSKLSWTSCPTKKVVSLLGASVMSEVNKDSRELGGATLMMRRRCQDQDHRVLLSAAFYMS